MSKALVMIPLLLFAFATSPLARELERAVPYLDTPVCRGASVGGVYGVSQGSDTFFYGGTLIIGGDPFAVSAPSAGWANRNQWTWSASGWNGVPHSGLPMDGWRGLDTRVMEEDYFNVKDNATLGEACIITGTQSLFCGATASECSLLCFVNLEGTGYGDAWVQGVNTPSYSYTIGEDINLDYNCTYDSEDAYDFTYVIVQIWDTIGSEWINYDTLAGYSGASVGVIAESWDLDGLYLPTPPVDFRILFQFVSDGGYSDGDCLYPTVCGAFCLDDYDMDDNGTHYTEDFEAVPVAALPFGWGRYVDRCGDFARAAWLNDLPISLSQDPCVAATPGLCAMADSVLVFYDQNEPGYPHPYCQSNFAVSPVIDLSDHPGLSGRLLAWERFANLPLDDGVFMSWKVRYRPGCASGGWSPWVSDNAIHYTPEGISCRSMILDISSWVPAEAEQAQVALGVVNFCNESDSWGVTCSNTCNETPFFDNVTFGVFGSDVAPVISMRESDYLQDQFAEDGTLNPLSTADTRTATVQAGLNPPIFGDTLICRGSGGDVEVRLVFRMAEVGPQQPTTHAFFTTWFPGVTGGGWYEARMDTAEVTDAYGYSTAVSTGTWMSTFHESDPRFAGEGIEILPNNLFVPGTRIDYFLKSKYEFGSEYDYFLLPDTLGGGYEEFEVLPMMRDDGLGGVEWPCLIVADHFGQRGNEAERNSDRISRYLADNGYVFDVFSKLAPSSNKKHGIARGPANEGQLGSPGVDKYNWGPGATIDQFSAYRGCILNTGDVKSGCVNEADVDLLTTWLVDYSSSEFPLFLWLSGDRVTGELDSKTAWGKPFLNNVLGVIHLSDDYNSEYGNFTYCGPMNGIPGGRIVSTPDPEVFVVRENGCPRRFSRIGASTATGGSPVEEVDYADPMPGCIATISNESSAGGSNYRTVAEGYDNCLSRTDDSQSPPSCGPETFARDWFDSVLRWGLPLPHPEYDFCNVPVEAVRPDIIYAFNSKPPDPNSVNRAADYCGHAWVFQEMGLLGSRGEPPTVDGDLLKDPGGNTVGSVIRANGTIIGYKNGDGSKEAYDLSSGAKFDQNVWDRIDALGEHTVIVVKHGTTYTDDQGLKHYGGNIFLDNGEDFAGFGPDTGGGGTNIFPDAVVYPLPAARGATRVILHGCWTTNDPDGAGGAESVAESLSDIENVTEVTGHSVKVYYKLRFVGLECPNEEARTNAMDKLQKAAKAKNYVNAEGDTGLDQITQWTADHPFEEQYNVVKNTANEGCLPVFQYVLSEDPADPPEDLGLAYYHVCPIQIGPGGGSVAYRDDSLKVADDCRVDIPQGTLEDYALFHIQQLPEMPGEPPDSLVSGIFDLSPRGHVLPLDPPVSLSLKYYWPDSSQIDLYRYTPEGAWEKITQGRLIDESGGTISVTLTDVGPVAVFASDSTVGVEEPTPRFRFAPPRCFPTPGARTVSMAYELASDGHVTVRILDVTGRHVCTVVDRRQQAGSHVEVWNGKTDDGSSASSGVYFCQFEFTDAQGRQVGKEAKKLVLLR